MFALTAVGSVLGRWEGNRETVRREKCPRGMSYTRVLAASRVGLPSIRQPKWSDLLQVDQNLPIPGAGMLAEPSTADFLIYFLSLINLFGSVRHTKLAQGTLDVPYPTTG